LCIIAPGHLGYKDREVHGAFSAGAPLSKPHCAWCHGVVSGVHCRLLSWWNKACVGLERERDRTWINRSGCGQLCRGVRFCFPRVVSELSVFLQRSVTSGIVLASHTVVARQDETATHLGNERNETIWISLL